MILIFFVYQTYILLFALVFKVIRIRFIIKAINKRIIPKAKAKDKFPLDVSKAIVVVITLSLIHI